MKIFFGILALLALAWLFDFSSWVQDNIELVTAMLVGGVIGMIWWVSDEIKEIKEIVRDLQNRD